MIFRTDHADAGEGDHTIFDIPRDIVIDSRYLDITEYIPVRTVDVPVCHIRYPACIRNKCSPLGHRAVVINLHVILIIESVFSDFSNSCGQVHLLKSCPLIPLMVQI